MSKAKGARRRPPAIEWDGEFSYPTRERLRAIFGSTSDEFAGTCLAWLLLTQEQPAMPPAEHARKASGALAAIEALGARNEAEAMFAMQMVATHDLAMEALANARRQGSETQAITLATGLLKVYGLQAEALAMLQGRRRPCCGRHSKVDGD